MSPTEQQAIDRLVKNRAACDRETARAAYEAADAAYRAAVEAAAVSAAPNADFVIGEQDTRRCAASLREFCGDVLRARGEPLRSNLEKFRREIAMYAHRCGRDPASIRIVPATKTQPAETVGALLKLGVEAAGENRVQELTEKYPRVDARMQWHFIGQLQTNKVKYIVDKVAMIQSLDRVALAEEIERQARKRGIIVPCLVEINIARAESHGGVLPEDACAFVETVRAHYAHIALKGIMGVLPHDGSRRAQATRDGRVDALPPFADGGDAERAAAEMEKLSKTLAERYPDMIELSMGMSEDYPTAIRYGATVLRPGRVLFGERHYGKGTENGNGEV